MIPAKQKTAVERGWNEDEVKSLFRIVALIICLLWISIRLILEILHLGLIIGTYQSA